MSGATGVAALLRAKDNGKVPEVIIASSILCLAAYLKLKNII